MKGPRERTVKLEIASRFDRLDAVQAVLIRLSRRLDLDEDAVHYMGVALRESIVNAIKHGNRGDEAKRVAVAFTVHADSIEVTVQDEGRGFDPDKVPDPVAPENLLKADGRGIFFMRSFMDEVSYSFPRAGGTRVRMLKRCPGPKGKSSV